MSTNDKPDTVDELAVFYFQDKLSKFCPADKDRPNGYEKEMFRAGYAAAKEENRKLKRQLEVAKKCFHNCICNDNSDFIEILEKGK